MEVRNDNYYVVHGWMRNDLKLIGADLQIYAIVYGFSQDGESQFSGSVEYLMAWTGLSKSTVMRSLDSLTSLGLLEKDEHYVRGTLKKPRYVAVKKRVDKYVDNSVDNSKDRCQNDTGQNSAGVKMNLDRCQNNTGTGVKMTPNNNIYIPKSNIYNYQHHQDIADAYSDQTRHLIRIWDMHFKPFKQTQELLDKIERLMNLESDVVFQALMTASRSKYLTGKINGKEMEPEWFFKAQNIDAIKQGKYDDRV